MNVMTRKEEFESLSKPSELIQFAIDDLYLAIDDGHTVNLNKWLERLPSGKYELCFVGAVMVYSLGLEIPKGDMYQYGPSRFGLDNLTSKKLLVINCLRQGMVQSSFDLMNKPRPKEYMSFDITPFNKNKDQFDIDIDIMCNYLKEHGL